MTIEEQAKNALSFFKSVNRRSESIWRLKDGTPKWVRDLVFKAHESGQILPNDYRYAYIVESLRLIGEGEEEPEFEADVYTFDLFAWLASNIRRQYYCDEAIQNYGGELDSIVKIIAQGQIREKEEVHNLVLNFLREFVDTEIAVEEGEDPFVAPREVERVPGEKFEDTDPMGEEEE